MTRHKNTADWSNEVSNKDMAIRWSILVVMGVTLAVQAQKPAASPPTCPASTSPANADQTGTTAPTGEQNKNRDKSSPATCSPTPTSERFPFPGEPRTSPSAGSTQTPEAPAPAGKHSSAGDQFPFPGSAPPMPGSASSSSSSSTSSSSSSSSADDPAEPPAPSGDGSALDDKGNNPRAAVRRRLPKVEKLQSDEERAAEDLEVAKFYEDSGDLNAAYLRVRDAVKVQPSDPEAHYALGHLAQKLNKREEAIAEFSSYIQLEPDGQKIKQAQKSLAQLQRP